MPGLSVLAYASPPLRLVRLTFVAHHAAPSTANRSVTPCRHLDRKCLTPKPRLQKAFFDSYQAGDCADGVPEFIDGPDGSGP
jgi:hypothetical protein